MNKGKVYQAWDLQDHSIFTGAKHLLPCISAQGLAGRDKEKLNMRAILFQIISASPSPTLSLFLASLRCKGYPLLKVATLIAQERF